MPEEHLLSKQDPIHLLVSSMVDYAIITLDAAGTVITWNEGAARAKGYSADEIIGRHFSCFYTQEDRDAGKPEKELLVTAREGRFEDFGWRLRKDGSKFFANVVITAFYDQSGVLLGFGKVTRDISERVKAEEALKEQNQILNLTHDTIMVRDLEGKIRYWNRGAEEMYGFSKEEAIGRISHELLQTKFPQLREAIEEEAMRSGRWDGELMHTAKDNRTVVVASRWALKVDSGGRPEAMLEINNDISERKAAETTILRAKEELELRVEERTRALTGSEERLQAKVLELERSNEDLQQFAYVCSHDLQEPLRVVSNYTQLLAKRYTGRVLDQDANEFIDFIVDAAKRMQELINDLLHYSRVQTKAREFDDCDCSVALQMAAANLKIAVSESQCRIDCQPLPVVKGDMSQILLVFQNLISNAIKFRSTQTPEILIFSKDAGVFWEIVVKDNGQGLDMKHADRIFIIFQRLHTREQFPGSGIGLAVCKKIVERHGGRIWVESEKGKGAEFHFLLPK